MIESPQEYSTRISSYVAGANHMRVLGQAPSKISHLLKGKSIALLTRRPEGGKWSVAEILAHLAESEIVFGYRIRMMVASPGMVIQAFDQNLWQDNAAYLWKSPRECLTMFTALRAMNVRFLKSLTPDKLERSGVHAERGVESVRRLVELTAGHDVNHARQIEAIAKQRVGRTKEEAGRKKWEAKKK
jgi:hypothetical protein